MKWNLFKKLSFKKRPKIKINFKKLKQVNFFGFLKRRKRKVAKPSKKDKKEEELEEKTCKNCETSFVGKFCSNCGQSDKEFERPIQFMIIDIMGSLITFDTRLVKTLKAILFQPGKLTLDFTQGRRMRYMPPFRFYIFISFVMFFLIVKIADKGIKNSDFQVFGDADEMKIRETVDSIRYSRTAVYDSIREELNVSLDTTVFIPEQKQETDTAESAFEKKLDEKMNEDKTKLMKEHPEIFVNAYLRVFSYALFLLMPIFAFFMWLFFMRQNKYYVTHLIFSLNIHSFMFVILSLIIAANLIFPDKVIYPESYLLLLIPVYHVAGVRRIYKSKWVKSLLMPPIVWFLYSLVLAFVSIVMILITFIVQ